MINEWAFECFQHKHYTNDWDDDYLYRCPTCDNNFKYVSALLRHAESRACSSNNQQSLGKMKRYIMTRVSELAYNDSS